MPIPGIKLHTWQECLEFFRKSFSSIRFRVSLVFDIIIIIFLCYPPETAEERERPSICSKAQPEQNPTRNTRREGERRATKHETDRYVEWRGKLNSWSSSDQIVRDEERQRIRLFSGCWGAQEESSSLHWLVSSPMIPSIHLQSLVGPLSLHHLLDGSKEIPFYAKMVVPLLLRVCFALKVSKTLVSIYIIYTKAA